jgi:hypothetical protein
MADGRQEVEVEVDGGPEVNDGQVVELEVDAGLEVEFGGGCRAGGRVGGRGGGRCRAGGE